jgi:hypothetical protein
VSKSETQLLDELRIEIAEYVKLRKRLGRPLTFAQALAGHRQVCEENSYGEPDDYWVARRRLCERLMIAEGIAPNSVPEIVR